MNKIVLSSIVAAAGIAASANAQTSGAYTFEFRLIPDGATGAPTGPGTAYNIGNPAAVSATRIGFWIQARVSQTANENWGIVRASSPTGGTAASFISVNDPAGASLLTRGSVNSNNSNFGRGSGYRNGGPANGAPGSLRDGNAVGSAPFPGGAGNENGALDNGGAGAITTRVYAFDSYVGPTRTAANPDEPSQPWNVNGAGGAGSPVAAGAFSPWASLYRVWIDITDFNTTRDVVVNASALLNGAIQAAPNDASQQTWAMQIAVDNGVVANASYTFHIPGVPTPGAAAVLGLGGLAAMRRRR
ncbi:MAG: hypothetical protein QM783_15625 [Phycisphaerales bacterium]